MLRSTMYSTDSRGSRITSVVRQPGENGFSEQTWRWSGLLLLHHCHSGPRPVLLLGQLNCQMPQLSSISDSLQGEGPATVQRNYILH